jgi:rhodanese-related sulfurtransferase
MSEGQPKTAAQMVAEAKGRIENLTPEQVANEIEGGDVTLIDIREDEDRIQNGAIPQSVHAPRGMLEFWADPTSAFHRKEFDPARRTILYCGGGGQSALAANTLQEMGYNVAHLDGGITAWKEEGCPVEGWRN